VVIEYSDLPEAMQQERDAEGELRFLAGSIAIHALDCDFVDRIGRGEREELRLPFHRAHKKVPVADESGETVKPDEPNGTKFEMFIFDAIPFAQNPLVLETDRAEEFSPVKNAEGRDSPETCRQDQLRQWARWLQAAGATLEVDSTGLPAATFEITSLYADGPEALAEKATIPAIEEGTVLEP
jgi:UDP-N-acetylglucosamine/UDP-N-acetylgalactosamine diphosphorylase